MVPAEGLRACRYNVRMGRCFIGTSGYVYKHWRGRFYPQALSARDWLPFYAERFATVELNNPFYRLPTKAVFAAWRRTVPSGFVFAVKASRYLTHLKRLKQSSDPVRRFLTRAAALEETLGPVLFQLPGQFHVDVGRLRRFLRVLGGQRHVPALRAVLEVRHASWLVPEVFDLLARANVALCLQDWREAPVNGPVTADFVYIRRHGTTHRYGGSYSDRMLRADARQIGEWLRHGRDVYVYFNNDGNANAVRNAQRLGQFLQRSHSRAA
jgi:uncharacterized protein YecE (DUF72 family)